MSIRVLELHGNPYQMGYAHGQQYAQSIANFSRSRIALSGDPAWAGKALSQHDVLVMAKACAEYHQQYAPDLYEEMRGMAEGAGVTLEEILIVNGFTDFIDTVYGANASVTAPYTPTPAPAGVGMQGCTAFMIPKENTAAKQAIIGQTWDMHRDATPHVILVRGQPETGPAFLTFTTSGCVGMIGMNAKGISVGINNLMATDGRPGVMWPLVVRKMLQQETLDEALACLENAPLAGAHNYLLMDKTGRGINVEASATKQHVTELDTEALVHTNHCLHDAIKAHERARLPETQAHSEARLADGERHLAKEDLTIADVQAMTRDEQAICTRPKVPMFVETSGAVIMQPSTGDFWALWGLPSENAYEHMRIAS